jgi:hypothetical protein
VDYECPTWESEEDLFNCQSINEYYPHSLSSSLT